jgi:excisionase family DNA binding protein
MNSIEELLTLKEAAKILKVNPKTISRWQKEGKVTLTFLPIGNRPRIKRSELNRIMNSTKRVDYLW